MEGEVIWEREDEGDVEDAVGEGSRRRKEDEVSLSSQEEAS